MLLTWCVFGCCCCCCCSRGLSCLKPTSHSLLPLHPNYSVSLHMSYTLWYVESCQLLLKGTNTDKVHFQLYRKISTNASLKTVISCEIQQDLPGGDQSNSKTLRLLAKIFCKRCRFWNTSMAAFSCKPSISFLEIQSPISLFSLPYENLSVFATDRLQCTHRPTDCCFGNIPLFEH